MVAVILEVIFMTKNYSNPYLKMLKFIREKGNATKNEIKIHFHYNGWDLDLMSAIGEGKLESPEKHVYRLTKTGEQFIESSDLFNSKHHRKQ